MTDELRNLQRDYLLDLRSVIDRLRQHGRDLGDHAQFKAAFPEVLFIAHQLKGSGGSLGFPAITDVARRLRDELTSFLEPAPPTAEQLAQHVLALCDELERAVDSAACRGD
jgi:chemotaxis protein histidine kinase CheA